jgi:hypothetical protein
MLLGRCAELKGPDRLAALGVLTEHLMPGRGADSRGPSKKELAQTSVLALPIDEWSLKVSNHVDPDDAEEDLDLPYWAGVLPLHHVWGEPRPSSDLRGTPPVPLYVATWPAGRT